MFTNSILCQTTEELNQQSKDLMEQGKYSQAFPLVKKAAELGNAEAQFNYATFLQEGNPSVYSEQEIIKWFLKSSDNGFNDAHYAMLVAYQDGYGVNQSAEKAFEYALKGANNDDVRCMNYVVQCYLNGEGVSQNEQEFKKWLVKLAKLQPTENPTKSGAITSARLDLAQYHNSGNYFEKDKYQSYIWYLIYNESKDHYSKERQQKIIKEIKQVQESLTTTQIKQAPVDAAQLMGRDLHNVEKLFQTSY
ncbi:tetratricopeptide repeat protein [Myroides sp. LJL116]